MLAVTNASCVRLRHDMEDLITEEALRVRASASVPSGPSRSRRRGVHAREASSRLAVGMELDATRRSRRWACGTGYLAGSVLDVPVPARIRRLPKGRPVSR